MRAGYLVVMGAMFTACGHAPPKPAAEQCDTDASDPNACLVAAEERLALHDEPGMRAYVERLVNAVTTSPACLRDHEARGCFAGIVALLREHAVGVLAPYDLADDLIDLAPRWTGSDATGPRAQARTALQGMCTVRGPDPIAQQRACLVLGDLVEDERIRRGADALAGSGWSTDDVIDGYAAACRVEHGVVPAPAYASFAHDVAHVYGTAADNAVCGVAASSRRGASIPDAIATRERIELETRAKAAGAESSATREAARVVAMERAKAEAAARAAIAEQAAFDQSVVDAIHRSDWALTFGLLTKRRGGPVGEPAATALNKIFEAFSDWAIAQANGSVAAAYLQLASRLERAPKNHAIRVSLAALRDRALVEAKATGKRAKGLGAKWLHAALVARVAGPLFPEEQAAAAGAWKQLVAATRISLDLQSLSPACAPVLAGQPIAGAKATIKAKSTLECTLESERIDGTHRMYKVIVHGVIAMYAGGPRRAVPIDIEDIGDDPATEPAGARTYAASLAAARDLLLKSTVGVTEAATAEKAYAAARTALKAGRKDAAENQLVIHGLLAGPSPELDEIMVGYGIAFADLLPN